MRILLLTRLSYELHLNPERQETALRHNVSHKRERRMFEPHTRYSSNLHENFSGNVHKITQIQESIIEVASINIEAASIVRKRGDILIVDAESEGYPLTKDLAEHLARATCAVGSISKRILYCTPV